jgi:glycosyltransferase involved in cell wall biosynthesis
MRRSVWIAVGVRGLFVVGLLAWVFRRSFIYNSLEIYASSNFDKGLPRIFKRLEAAINRRALFTIIQDERRAALQRNVNELGPHKFVVFPNAPLAEVDRQSTSRTMPASHRALRAAEQGAATSRRVLSYSGSIAEWGGFSALPLIAAALPDDWMIIVQSRMRIDQAEQVSRDDLRLVVSTEPLSVADYHCFVRMSDVGLAWYEPSDPNLRFVGMSSGKIAQYWALGKPIIVNRLPLYEEVFERFHCGILVDRPDEIPAALARIAADLPSYQQGALDAFRMYFDIESHGSDVARELRAACDGMFGK